MLYIYYLIVLYYLLSATYINLLRPYYYIYTVSSIVCVYIVITIVKQKDNNYKTNICISLN